MFKKIVSAACAALLLTALSPMTMTAHSSPTTYTVKKGDTLYKIAKKHGSTVATIQKCSGVKGHLIYPKQKLTLQCGSTAVEKTTATAVKQTPKISKKTIQTTVDSNITRIAKEVIAGKWGNGSDRKNRLTQACYDYAAVQAKVNELMK